MSGIQMEMKVAKLVGDNDGFIRLFLPLQHIDDEIFSFKQSENAMTKGLASFDIANLEIVRLYSGRCHGRRAAVPARGKERLPMDCARLASNVDPAVHINPLQAI